jgi:hypothetical protein
LNEEDNYTIEDTNEIEIGIKKDDNWLMSFDVKINILTYYFSFWKFKKHAKLRKKQTLFCTH